MFHGIKDCQKVEDVELDLPEGLPLAPLRVVHRPLLPSAVPGVARKSHGPNVLDVGSQLVLV
jgi:hypothetical protein